MDHSAPNAVPGVTPASVDQSLLDAIPVPIFIKDRQGVYLACNVAYEAVVGRRREDIIGKTVHAVAPPALADYYQANDLAMFKGQAVQVYESKLIDSEGGSHEVVFHKATFGGADGQPAGIVGVIHDVTARKHAEQRLRDSERRYRTLFDHANDAILILRGGTFIDCNALSLDVYGCTREQILRATPWQFSPLCQPDGRPSMAAARAWIDAALRGTPQRFEWLHCRLDGTPFDAEVSLNAIDVDGEWLVQAIVRDVTERKRAADAVAAALRENEALVAQLREALDNVKTLSGFLPICMYCRKVRDDQGYWEKLESYISAHTGTLFSHGLCPDCEKKFV